MLQISRPLTGWPAYNVHQNLPNHLQCSQCENQCNITFANVSFPEILFVEFTLELMSILPFSKFIKLPNSERKLTVLVRHLDIHFPSAVCGENGDQWLYIDELIDNYCCFPTLNMLERFSGSYFFGVFLKDRPN